MKKTQLLVENKITASHLLRVLHSAGVQEKEDFSDDEVSAIQQAIATDAADKSSKPKTKADRSNAAPSIPDEQVGITTANVQDAALERVTESRDVSGQLVDSLISAAQAQAKMQAQVIAGYPQLVDNLTVGYLQEMGVVDAGKSMPSFDLTVECPEMDAFTALLESSGNQAKTITAARNLNQLNAAG